MWSQRRSPMRNAFRSFVDRALALRRALRGLPTEAFCHAFCGVLQFLVSGCVFSMFSGLARGKSVFWPFVFNMFSGLDVFAPGGHEVAVQLEVPRLVKDASRIPSGSTRGADSCLPAGETAPPDIAT